MQIIQSERFSALLVGEIEKSFLQNTGSSLKFDKVSISLFPPATSVSNVEFSQVFNKKQIGVKAKSLVVEFSFINMLASEIVLEALKMRDASIEVVELGELTDLVDEQKKLAFKDVSKVLKNVVADIHSALPIQVNEVELKRVYVNTQKGSGFVSELDLKLYSNFIIGKFQLTELYHPGEFKDVNLDAIDSITGEIEISKTKLEAKNIILKNKLNELSSSLTYDFDQRSYLAQIDYRGGLDGQFKRLLDSYNQYAEGYADAVLVIEGVDSDFSAKLDLDLYDIKTNYFLADKVSLLANYENKKLNLNRLTLEHDEGKIDLRQPVSVYDFTTREITSEAIKISAENFHTNSALYAIRRSLDVFKGRLKGELEVSLLKKERVVRFKLGSGLKLNDFKLELGREYPLLEQNEIVVSRGEVKLNTNNSLVNIDTEFTFGNKSQVKAKGSIGLGKLDIDVYDSVVDFTELGPISGFPMKGMGPISMKIRGPLRNVEFAIEANHKNFSLLGFNLENTKAEARLSLFPLKLSILKLEGSFEDAVYSSVGVVNFFEKKFALDVLVSKMNYAQAKHVLTPVASLIERLPENLEYTSTGKFKVSGGFEPGELDVKGDVSLKQIEFNGEGAEQMSFNLSYERESLSIKNLKLKKADSFARGNFLLDFNSSYFEYDVSWNNINLSDWNFYNKLRLGLSSKLDLDLYGSGQTRDYTTRTQASLRESSIQGYQLEDSLLTIFNESDEYYINAAIFGQMLNLDSYINTQGSSAKEPSQLNAKINVKDIRVPLGLLSSHNIFNPNLAGAVNADINAQFQTDRWETLDLKARTSELYFDWGEVNFRPQNGLRLDIEKGEFTTQSLGIESDDLYYIKPQLEGSLSKNISLNTSFELPASLLSLISTDLSVTGGAIKGSSSLRGKLGSLAHTASMETENVVLQVPQVPGVFDKINLSLELENKNLVVKRSTASYGKGNLELSGAGVLNLPSPSLNLQLLIDNSYISFMKRSGGVVSGRANLSGEGPPYLVKGHVDILFAEIIENINDFQAAGTQTSSYQRFLPRQDGSGLEHPFELDLTVSILRPLLVRNSLLELNIEGEAEIKGTPRLPQINGQFNAVAASSKFKFKGHEFNLTKGSIEVGRSLQREGAILDFSGIAQINEYRVRLDVSGMTKNVEVALSSEPSLSQEDIFSLLTLGVTSEISTELEESERQSVATVGLGALLADQLRLNEGLDSSFGVRLSVAPEYAEETTSLLQGKSAVSDNSTNKFKSSTRIRLQKKVSDKVDLSVSSTVGGSLEQSQEMNINYRFNNRWSLEGVYELKSTEDEGVETSDSVGADLKYRWTF